MSYRYCPRCGTRLSMYSDTYTPEAIRYTCITCGYEYIKLPPVAKVATHLIQNGDIQYFDERKGE